MSDLEAAEVFSEIRGQWLELCPVSDTFLFWSHACYMTVYYMAVFVKFSLCYMATVKTSVHIKEIYRFTT